jgi:hypothetical protein
VLINFVKGYVSKIDSVDVIVSLYCVELEICRPQVERVDIHNSLRITMDIDNLLESGAFSAESIPQLEKHVKDQSTGSVPYHYAANRTLAKLYQFFPDCNNDSMLASLLALALLQFPQTDILALLCLIPEKSQESEPIATVIR